MNNPEKHYEAWNDRWGTPVNHAGSELENLEWNKALERCNFIQGSARKLNAPIKEYEVATAMLNTRLWKVAGPDGVHASLVKRYFNLTIPILTRLYNDIWKVNSIPGEWFTTGRTILFQRMIKTRTTLPTIGPLSC